MAGYKDVFERIEVKYLLDDMQYVALRKRLEGMARVDSYGKTSILNIYLILRILLLSRILLISLSTRKSSDCVHMAWPQTTPMLLLRSRKSIRALSTKEGSQCLIRKQLIIL